MEKKIGPVPKLKRKLNGVPFVLHPDDFISIFKTLCAIYPKAFSFKEVKVLKIGIIKDLFADIDKHKISKRKLKRFISQYVNTPEYMAVHIKDSIRYDLQGNVTGSVSKEEAKSKYHSNKIYIKYRITNPKKIPQKSS